MTDEQAERVIALLIEIRDKLTAPATQVRASTGSAAGTSSTGDLATDAEMDGQYGNKPVFKDPPRWKGESFKGRPLSECSAEFLDEMASFCDWKAANPQAGKEPKGAPAK